ncbi:hypothetical protein [Turicibacter sanguinis]|uniref:hypothetical protein n=1 Tax=Turicibacter sanguinis TaxID=154288 RepID=UPI00189E1562|nr:hypothetical protein [Turicibacter sanguinis]
MSKKKVKKEKVVKEVKNPGSAVGEAIGAQMEIALNKVIKEFVEEIGYTYVTSGVRKNKNGTLQKKLLMFDNFNNQYSIDGVIINDKKEPLIIFESKYIRYKKHNKDKGSWICNTHSAVRKAYHSIRASIAVLGGEWSSSSLTMIQSFGTEYFLIPFDKIVAILGEYKIDFIWEEKEKSKAWKAWEAYSNLTKEQKEAIGDKMIAIVKEPLIDHISKILDNSTPRKVEMLKVNLMSNLGETKEYSFESIEEATDFLKKSKLEKEFLEEGSLKLDEIPKFNKD